MRLVDTALENMRYLQGIARIRAYYRTLTPEAATYFAAEHGRWPEGSEPSQRLGGLMALATTSASMVAVINAIVAGCGLAMAASRMGGMEPRNGLMLGAIAAFVLVAAFVAYEHWRFNGAADSGRRPSGEKSVLIAPCTSLLGRRGGGSLHDRVFPDESRIDLDS